MKLKCFVFVNIFSLKDSTLHVGKYLSVHVTFVPNSSFFFLFFFSLLTQNLSVPTRLTWKQVISWPNLSQAAVVGMCYQTRHSYWLLDPRNWTFKTFSVTVLLGSSMQSGRQITAIALKSEIWRVLCLTMRWPKRINFSRGPMHLQPPTGKLSRFQVFKALWSLW